MSRHVALMPHIRPKLYIWVILLLAYSRHVCILPSIRTTVGGGFVLPHWLRQLGEHLILVLCAYETIIQEVRPSDALASLRTEPRPKWLGSMFMFVVHTSQYDVGGACLEPESIVSYP